MAMRADVGSYLRGTSRGLPQGRDYEYFCDSICDVYVGVLPDRPGDDPYPADFALYQLGATHAGRLSAPGGPAGRDRAALIRHPDDGVFLNFSRTSWFLEHLGRTWTVPAGVPFLLDNSETYRLTFDPRRRMELYTLRIPREQLVDNASRDIRRIDDRIAVTDAGRHLTAQASLLTAVIDNGNLDAAAGMASALVGLINAVADRSDITDRLTAFKSAAMRQIENPSFGVSALAREFKCSVRTVQSAFGERGETFSEWFLAERLELARERLSSPSWNGKSVLQVATSVGFVDASTFHRQVRSRYGTTPSRLR